MCVLALEVLVLNFSRDEIEFEGIWSEVDDYGAKDNGGGSAWWWLWLWSWEGKERDSFYLFFLIL